MSCTALNKIQSRCNQVLDQGSLQWCTYHCKKLIKYYKTYKSIEATIECLDNDNVLDSYSMKELIDTNTKLIKVYHYRSTLREQGYPEYQDAGHQKRLEIIESTIKKITNRMVKINDTIVKDCDESISRVKRSSVSTSTKQHKRKKGKQVHAQLLPEDYINDKLVMKICNHLTKKYLLFLMEVVCKYFTDKFGTEKGLKLFQTSLACAHGVYKLMYGSEETVGNSKIMYRTIVPGSILDEVSLKPGSSARCNYQEFILKLRVVCELEYGADDLTHDSKLKLFFYVIYIVIHSYQIDPNDTLGQTTNVFGGIGIDYDNELIPIYKMKLVANLEKEKDDYLYKKAYQKQREILYNVLARGRENYPQLNLGFCMKMAWTFEATEWKLYHIADGKCSFISPFICSDIVDLQKVKEVYDFYHFCIVKRRNISEYCCKLYREEFTDEVEWMIATILGSYSNNFSMLIQE